jgi:hypothetical protein
MSTKAELWRDIELLVGFVADEPGFVELRPQLREMLKETETELRRSMADLVASFPDHWLATSDLGSKFVVDIPKTFTRSLRPVLCRAEHGA